MNRLFTLLFFAAFIAFFSCSDKDDNLVNEGPQLMIKFQFDPNQARLDNLGQPATVSIGKAAQSPVFNTISAHYFELAPNEFTQLGEGSVLYHAAETISGGDIAIDFSQSKIVSDGETFLSIPLSEINQGSYQYVRVSLSYQNYNISILNNGNNYTATLESFVGYNTYITNHNIGNNIFNVNANRLQGYWALGLHNFPYATSGQAPQGATTVPNPIASTSAIPQGSCVVTGKFSTNLVITGNENRDIIVTLSLSTNNSFEWQEVNVDGKFEPTAGENVIDMGVRGLQPTFTR
ncbi:hypothetical protein FIA58_016675 [Flavobacterium jejuense]|uniref:DUF1735 domain-containing protein n=1 Tax=Flavobacterium jejuense TaxID=1544455 RepID=A0ABX0IU42_9FLAO|nr:hypothetical protein [Flavobacterium jejuense]NHN27317.1 hypothetical protein [Flavobacterium jejuense]